ncbi:MAG: prepilin-type N-terminal cleavage/methylation domain-containing protein [bacterium]
MFNPLRNFLDKKKIKNSRGFTLIEVVLIIVVLAIAIPSLMRLLSSVLDNSQRSVIISKAVIYAQEKMDEIIADKQNPLRGFNWVVTPGTYQSDIPSNDYTRSVVIDTTGKIQNGVRYALVQVSVSNSEISDITLTTWLTEY